MRLCLYLCACFARLGRLPASSCSGLWPAIQRGLSHQLPERSGTVGHNKVVGTLLSTVGAGHRTANQASPTTPAAMSNLASRCLDSSACLRVVAFYRRQSRGKPSCLSREPIADRC